MAEKHHGVKREGATHYETPSVFVAIIARWAVTVDHFSAVYYNVAALCWKGFGHDTHLLKWQIQPDLRSGSWKNTIRTQRREIGFLLDDSPSLRRHLDEFVEQAYPYARVEAIDETGLLAPYFPDTCPYTQARILDSDFFPDA